MENQLFLNSQFLFFEVCQNQWVWEGAVDFVVYATIQIRMLSFERGLVACNHSVISLRLDGESKS
jgi:hypothetical protein